jgi:glycine oxidase
MEDCLIVGAGVVGLSLAYELACHGLRVRVVDRSEPGREASWAGAGILPPASLETAEHPYEKLRGLSHQLHPRWAERLRDETGIDTGFRRCGAIHVARTAGESAALAGWADLLTSLRVDVRRLPRDELAVLEPVLRDLAESDSFRAAYLLPDEAQLRNPWHLQALLAACRRRGVVVDGGIVLHEISRRGRSVTAVRSSAGDLQASRYAICAGAWSHGMLRQLDVDTGILPVRGQMILFRGPTAPFTRVLNEGSRYLVPRDDGHVLAGSTEEEVGFDKSTTAEAIRDLTRFAYGLVAGLRQFVVEQTWAGLRPGTLDGFPYIGPIPGLDNAFAAAGHFRSGLFLSTGTAVVLGQLIRGETPIVELGPFRVGRG